MKIRSVSSYCSDGLLDPEPVMYGFGKEKPNIVIIRYALEYSSDGFDIFKEETGTPGTEFKLSEEYGDDNLSYITGQKFVGWSLDYENAEVGIVDFRAGEVFVPSMRGVYTFFPVFEPYIVLPSQDAADMAINSVTVSVDNPNATFTTDVKMLPDSSGTVDEDKVVVVPFVTYSAVFSVEDQQQGTEDTDYEEIRIEIDGFEIAFEADGEYEHKLSYEDTSFAKIASSTVQHTVKYLYGKTPVNVRIVDKIVEWHVYPKMVYITGQPDEQSPGG